LRINLKRRHIRSNKHKLSELRKSLWQLEAVAAVTGSDMKWGAAVCSLQWSVGRHRVMGVSGKNS